MNDPFHLPAPPGFRGLHPQIPIRIYQRLLPHWRQDDATYFVTFRLADSIPQDQLKSLTRWREIWEQGHPEPRRQTDWLELAKEITNKSEKYLDQGYGACELEQSAVMNLMVDTLLKFQNTRYFISCFAVMPNHVHAVLKPLEDLRLEVILRDMKGYLSRQTNRMLSRIGALWAEESYDRIIRDEEHLWEVVQYIGQNGRTAGLSNESFRRWLHPEWIECGWRFVDE